MEPGGSMSHSQGLSNNPYPEPNQPNSRINTYLAKIHSNIVIPTLRTTWPNKLAEGGIYTGERADDVLLSHINACARGVSLTRSPNVLSQDTGGPNYTLDIVFPF